MYTEISPVMGFDIGAEELKLTYFMEQVKGLLSVCFPDAAVHPILRLWMERLLSGAGVFTGAALHTVSLPATQPAVDSGTSNGEWYSPQHQHLHCVLRRSLYLLHSYLYFSVCRIPNQSFHLLIQSS